VPRATWTLPVIRPSSLYYKYNNSPLIHHVCEHTMVLALYSWYAINASRSCYIIDTCKTTTVSLLHVNRFKCGLK